MPTPGSLDATDLRYISIGCWAWSSTRGRDGVEDDGVTQVDPLGGLVLDVSETVDRETGEVARAFVVADNYRGRLRLRRLVETEVDRTRMEAAGPGEIARVFRLLCLEIATSDRRRLRTGVVPPEHKTMATYVHRLAGLL